MNIINIERNSSGGITVYADINGFEHNCTVDPDVLNGAADIELIGLAEVEISEAYERFAGG